MTTQEKLVNRKLSIIELAEFLKNVSQACRINGVSRQHFYDIKKAYNEHGIEGLKEKSEDGDSGNFGFNDINKLQMSKTPI